MPSAAEHKSKRDHNWEFVSFVEANSASFNDWIVTGLFYMALHQVEGYFAPRGKHFTSHEIRNRWLNKLQEFKPIWPDYRDLQYMSRNARYEPSVVIQASDVEDGKDILETIENRIRSLL